MDTGRSPDDLPSAMDNRDKWRRLGKSMLAQTQFSCFVFFMGTQSVFNWKTYIYIYIYIHTHIQTIYRVVVFK